MTPEFQNGLEQRMPAEVAEELRTLPLDAEDLRAALANAFDRIADLEQLNRIL